MKKRGWRDFTRHMWSLKMEQGGGDHGLVRAIQEAGDRMCAELCVSWWHGGLAVAPSARMGYCIDREKR